MNMKSSSYRGLQIYEQFAKYERPEEKLDMDFLKTEIYSLMKGIEEGADTNRGNCKGLKKF